MIRGLAMNLVLYRGLPGSGKSTAAATQHPTYIHVEADAYFVKDGVYTFDPAKLGQAHAWCLGVAEGALMAGASVTVANTFTKRWEMAAYEAIAKRLGARLTVITMTGNYGNTHGVPAETVEKMRVRWED
jgi:predicted kinase